MILYSVTVNIDAEIHEEWINWMRTIHVPEVLKTNCFKENKIMKLLDPPQEGHTYSFQYLCESLEILNEYQTQHAQALQAKHQQRYANKFAAFRTILEVID